ncbi:MAG: HAMP domain-containing sensor histidine kinase [Wenzhouxiangellaceae bacterium]|nr:HAMP domain-containing sensor histidine kinase [Wenzhouxiangellaceae bacterium]
MSWANRFLRGGIRTKLVRVFLLQILAISLATVLGVWGAALVVEKVLVREALNGEAEHFWSHYHQDADFPLPNTDNLRGYIDSDRRASDVPEWLQRFDEGFGRVITPGGRNPVVHVSRRDGESLYLVFDEVQVSALAFYFGIAPLSAVLLLIYLLTWLGYVMSRRAVSSMIQLADAVRTFDFAEGNFEALKFSHLSETSDTEVLALMNALEQFVDRLERFVARERNFTRNASHELRTPLAVLKGNLDLLQKFPDPEKSQAVVARMKRTVKDMESLVETLLILARESESKLSWSHVVLNDLVSEQLDQVRRAIPKREVEMTMSADCLLETRAPERVLAIIFHNLIRNAVTFTETGKVVVHVDRHAVTVRDTGVGMSESDLERAFEPFYRAHDRSNEGYGLGLAIVSRLCRRFGWPLEADSELGVGTMFRVNFPDAEAKPFRNRPDGLAGEDESPEDRVRNED